MGANGNRILMAILTGLVLVWTVRFFVIDGHFLFHKQKFETIGDVSGISQPPPPEVPSEICALLATADISLGESIAKANCTACHQFTDPIHGQGPQLVGIVGRDIAGTDFGSYSPALRALGGQWDYESLNAFLHKPAQYVPATAMNFSGWDNSKTQLRANVIAYLYSVSGAELPACPVDETVDEGETAPDSQD